MHGPSWGFLIFVLCMVLGLIAVVGLVLSHRLRIRALLSQERLASIAKGVEIPWETDLQRPRSARRLHLKAGVVLIGAGLGLLAASFVLAAAERELPLVWGILFLVLGTVNVVYDALVGRNEWERSQALDEALVRAYIRRLEAGGHSERSTGPRGQDVTLKHGGTPEAADTGD
jgi:Domain of unknown function (DUF6249)